MPTTNPMAEWLLDLKCGFSRLLLCLADPTACLCKTETSFRKGERGRRNVRLMLGPRQCAAAAPHTLTAAQAHRQHHSVHLQEKLVCYIAVKSPKQPPTGFVRRRGHKMFWSSAVQPASYPCPAHCLSLPLCSKRVARRVPPMASLVDPGARPVISPCLSEPQSCISCDGMSPAAKIGSSAVCFPSL